MALTIFDYAKKYRNAHPKTAWTECVKQGAKMMKKPAVKKAVVKKSLVKKSVASVPKKRVVKKVTTTKKVVSNSSIGAVSLGSISKEQNYISRLEKDIANLTAKAKDKSLMAIERNKILRMIAQTKAAIKTSKTHIQQLKKLL